jgi:DNA-binding response OmpR family regulator
MQDPAEPHTNGSQVGILILEESQQAAASVRQLLDSEGWRVQTVADVNELFSQIRDGQWNLVIANIAVTGTDSPVFFTLRELSAVRSDQGGRLRTLYIVPEMSGSHFVKALEQEQLHFVTRPFHFHDFLEKVSDLLVEVEAIAAPLRQVSFELDAGRKKKKDSGQVQSMFAKRDPHSYTEEELSAYELEEAGTSKRKRLNLGNPHGE